MSLKSLQLDPLTLTYAAEHLKLTVSSIADIRLPAKLASRLGDELSKELTTGCVWTARGRACRFELQLLFNGKPLEVPDRLQIIESLGCHIRDAHLWSQLSLSPSLNIPQQGIEALPSDIILYLNHKSFPITTTTTPRGWQLDAANVKPPDGVLCAEFQRLQLRLDLGTDQKRSCLNSKRIRSNLEASDTQEVMLLDQPPGKNTLLKALEDLVEDVSQNPVTAVEACFPNAADAKHTSEPAKKAANRLPAAATEILLTWFQAHCSSPYPTKDEKEKLMSDTGLTAGQLRSWFSHQRSRQKLASSRNSGKMLLTSDATQLDRDMLLTDSENDGNREILPSLPEAFPEDTENSTCLLDPMLLSETPQSDSENQLFDEIASLLPMLQAPAMIVTDPDDCMLLSPFADGLPPPTMATDLTTLSSSRKRPKEVTNKVEISQVMLASTSICKLVQAAILIFIAGQAGRCPKIPLGISIKKPPLTSNLSTLVPSIFSPGYKQLIAHNSQFLPTISNAMSSSWIRNAQGSQLREKLAQLSNLEGSGPANALQEGRGLPGSIERLSSVIEGRVWNMMQRKLFDPSSARRLRWKDVESATNDIDKAELCDDFDLLQEYAFRDEHDLAKDTLVFPAEFMDEEEELLLHDLWTSVDDGSDLLDYVLEVERRAVERETDEMLFGTCLADEGFLIIDEEVDLGEIMLL